MKRSIVLSFVLILLASVAWGQSACQQLGVNCGHPTSPSGPTPNRQPQQRQSGGDDDNLTTEDLANQKINPAVQFKNSFAESQNSYYFNSAKELLDEALRIKPNDGRALMVTEELYLAQTKVDHHQAWLVAQKARDYAEFSSGYNKKGLHAWFTALAAEQYDFYLLDWIADNCEVHTEAAGSGGTFDPSTNVMAAVQECQKARRLEAEAAPIREKEVAKYKKKHKN